MPRRISRTWRGIVYFTAFYMASSILNSEMSKNLPDLSLYIQENSYGSLGRFRGSKRTHFEQQKKESRALIVLRKYLDSD